MLISDLLVSDEWDFESDSAVRKVGRFANNYYEDHDSVANSSKRQDRALLNDITSRMVGWFVHSEEKL